MLEDKLKDAQAVNEETREALERLRAMCNELVKKLKALKEKNSQLTLDFTTVSEDNSDLKEAL